MKPNRQTAPAAVLASSFPLERPSALTGSIPRSWPAGSSFESAYGCRNRRPRVPRILAREPVADADSRPAVGGIVEQRCRAREDDGGDRAVAPRVGDGVVVALLVEKRRAEPELVPDLHVEVGGAVGAPDEIDDGADVPEPAAQRLLEGRVRLAVGELWRLEGRIAQRRDGHRAGGKRHGQRPRQRRDAIRGEARDQVSGVLHVAVGRIEARQPRLHLGDAAIPHKGHGPGARSGGRGERHGPGCRRARAAAVSVEEDQRAQVVASQRRQDEGVCGRVGDLRWVGVAERAPGELDPRPPETARVQEPRRRHRLRGRDVEVDPDRAEQRRRRARRQGRAPRLKPRRIGPERHVEQLIRVDRVAQHVPARGRRASLMRRDPIAGSEPDRPCRCERDRQDPSHREHVPVIVRRGPTCSPAQPGARRPRLRGLTPAPARPERHRPCGGGDEAGDRAEPEARPRPGRRHRGADDGAADRGRALEGDEPQ